MGFIIDITDFYGFSTARSRFFLAWRGGPVPASAPGGLQRILAYCVAVGGMYSGFVAPLNVPHDHSYLDGDSPPTAAFQHSISEVQSFLGHIPLGNRCAPAGRIHPPAPEVRISVSRRGSICSFRWSVVTARLFPSPKVAAFLLSRQCEPSPSAAGVPNRRGYLFRLQACSDRPQGCVPRISPLARRCQNDAAGGEVTSKAGVSWDTFNGTPKPKQVPPPDKNETRPRSHTPILFTICCGFSRIRGSA